MISLTPGTTTIDIDMERHEMLLHMLDTSDAASAVAGIRHDFERYLVILFGRSRA
jgi:multisubunit Na+/H+ antiporter MnhE subunit